jgi:hypothetical protein
MTNEGEYLKTAMYAKLYGRGGDDLDKLIGGSDPYDYEADELDDDLIFDDDLAEDNFDDDESYYYDEDDEDLDDEDCDDYYDYWEDAE